MTIQVSSAESVLLCFAAAGCIALFVWLFQTRSHTVKALPPGPVPKPLIGNILDLPSENVAREFAAWSKKYNSDILYATALGEKMLILNKKEDADELLEKRSAITSDRPVFAIIRFLGWDFNFGLFQYNDDWRLHRRICQNFLGQGNLSTLYPVVTEKVHQLLGGFLSSPQDFTRHNKMLSISIPMKTMYGYDIKTIHDPCIEAAETGTQLAAYLLIPKNSIINIFPVLGYIPAWFPGASSHKLAAKVKSLAVEMDEMTTDFVKKRMMEGTAAPSLLSSFLERKETEGATDAEERATRNIAMTVYIDTICQQTMSATMTFFYIMAAYPDVQRKAQTEIDRVIGSNRLPNFDDRESLPYIEAVYREVMRWMPAGQLGVPHCASEDSYYKGYFIPKGTTIYANLRAITRDEDIYDNPEIFNPERYLDGHGNLNADSQVIAYGFGRRVCVGKSAASATIWLTIACVVASFNLSKVTNEEGEVIGWNDDFDDSGLLIHKRPFECCIQPRSESKRSLIEVLSI